METTKRKQYLIDRQKIKDELERTQLLDIQKNLVKERRKRLYVMSLLLSALIFTIIYGTIENPFLYTFSKIGNRFTIANRVFFITWAGYTGFVIQASILTLMTLEKYKNTLHYTFIGIAMFFLVGTALAPSLDQLPFWTWIHLATAGLFALFLTLGFYPFMLWVARENPRLRQTVFIWFAVSWGGSIILYFVVGNTGLFEIWFFIFFIIFLLYLSMNLFEEQIVKQSIILLKDEDNLNLGIEKIFINLEEEKRRDRRNKRKKTG